MPELTLEEKDRQKLDSIVGQMVSNKESDDAIQFVVNDFKNKYSKKPAGLSLPTQKQQTGFSIDPVGTYTQQKPEDLVTQLTQGGKVEQGVITVPGVHKIAKINKPDIGEAIDDLVAKRGSLTPEGADVHRKAITKAYRDGDLVLGKDKNGKSVLKRGTGFIESFSNAVQDAFNSHMEDEYVASLTPEQKIRHFELKPSLEKERDTAPSGVLGQAGSFVGENANMLMKGAVGAVAATVAAPLVGLSAGANAFGSFAALANQFTKSGYAKETETTYNRLRSENPLMSKEEAIDKAHNAGLIGAASELAMGAAMSKGLDIQPEAVKGVVDGIIKTGKHLITKEIPAMSGIAAADELVKKAGEASQGADVTAKEVAEGVRDKVIGTAAFVTALHGLTIPSKIPSFLLPQMENLVATNRPQAEAALKTVEAKGKLPKGTTDEVLKRVDDFSERKESVDQLPISEEKKAAIAGLLGRIERLETQKRKLEKHGDTFIEMVNDFDKQIIKTHEKIKKIKENESPFNVETDRLTGEKPEKSILNPLEEKVNPEEISQPIELDPHDTRTTGTVSEPILPNEVATKEQGSQTEVPGSTVEAGHRVAETTPSVLNENTTESNPADQQGIISPKEEVRVNEVPSENTQAAEGGKEPPTVAKVIEVTAEGKGGITHEANAPRREQGGLGEYKPEYKPNDQLFEEGRKLLEEKYKGNVDNLLSELEQPNRSATNKENAILADYSKAVDDIVEKDPLNKEARARSNRLATIISKQGYEQGAGLQSRKLIGREDNLANFLREEAESAGVKIEDLPDEAVTELQEEYIQKKDLEAKVKEAYDKGMADALSKKAHDEIAKKAKNKSKLSIENSAKKKEILQSIKDKWKNAGKDGTLTAVPIPYAKQLAAIAPDVVKLVDLYISEGVSKLDEVITKVHETLKEGIPEITKNDVRDIIAGVHNEKKATRNDLAEQRVNMRKEAQLLSKIEAAMKGNTQSGVRNKINKSSRIQELQNRLKELKQRSEPSYDMSFVSDAEKLAKRKKAVLDKIKRLTADLKDGKFESAPPKPIDFKKDKELHILEDRLAQVEGKIKMRRERQEYDKLTPIQKKLDTMWQILGVKRIIGAAVDFSVPFRQANTITMNPFKGKTTATAFYNMFRLSFSPVEFKRFQNQVEKSDMGRMFVQMKGVFSNPSEIRPDKREEEYINNIFKRVASKIDEGNNKVLKGAVNVIDKAWFSERAAAAFLNTMRIEEFAQKTKELRRQGYTPENAPELYQDAVKWIMNNTGRGNLIAALEDSHNGRMIANNTYFGARLMAAKMNMLNPAYYAKMKPQVRIQAMKDMAGYVSGLAATSAAIIAAGGTMNTNKDDPDFLQARFGDKVYDISGGSVAYVRTALRIFDAMYRNIRYPGSKDAKLYSEFAIGSAGRTLVVNKLSPNTAYAWHFITGKSSEYDENGHRKPFDPLEAVKIYPMWADDAAKGYKENGYGATFNVLVPNIFGIGFGEYPAKVKKGSFGGAGAGGNIRDSRVGPGR